MQKLLYLNILTAAIQPFISNDNTVVAQKSRPNILWITIEDTSPQFIACYGNKNAKTPNIDNLSNEGVRFTNAFSVSTVSSPSRSALIAGVHNSCSGMGHHRSQIQLPSFIKGFPEYLKESGYFTSNNYKTDYNVIKEEDFITKTWDECSTRAHWSHRKPGQPFFAVINLHESHQSRTMSEPYQWYLDSVYNQLDKAETISEDSFEMPPFYRDSPEMRKHHARVYNSVSLTDKKIGQILKQLEQDGLRDSTVIFFFADHGQGIPRGKTNGINLGYRVPMAIWVPETFKELSSWKNGSVSDELIDFTDLAPTVLSLADVSIPDYMQGKQLMGKNKTKPVSHLYLTSDRSDDGIDMVRTISDGRFVYSRNYMPNVPALRYIRYMEIGEIKQQIRKDYKNNQLTDFQKSLLEARPAEYLYDINNDIWEEKNLATQKKHSKILKEMRSCLSREIVSSKDIMFLPEYEINRISTYSTPYNYRQLKDSFQIKQILKAADLSGFKGENIAQKQVKLLQSSNRFVRYWAILGLSAQPYEVLSQYKQAIEAAITDTYPPVSILAAGVSFLHFGNKKAEENLKLNCLNNNNDLALLAMNSIMYYPESEKRKFVDTVIASYKIPNRIYAVKVGCMDFLGSLGLVPNDMKHRVEYNFK